MKNIRHWKKLVIAMVIGLLVFQNVSPVLATMTDDETAKTTLKITKEDKDTKEKINGSTFEIKNKETGETNDLTISANGEATMDSLSPGDYLVKEKVAPKGYTLDEKEYSVTLAEKEEVITSVSAKVQEETTKEATTPTPVKKATQNANLKAAITDNIFNKVTLKDGNGDEINTSDRIQNGSGVVLNMNFAFSGKNYKAGDTFTTVLPDAFNFGNKNLSGNFLPSTEAEWTLDVTTRELTITFLKDGIQEGDYDVNISTAFKVFTSTEETIQEVVFKTAGKDTVYQIEVVPVVNYPTTVGITANPGVVNPTKGQVDAKFNLTKEKDAKGELKLNDYASGGTTTIDKDTIKVYSSDVSAGGTFIGTKKLLVEGTDYTLTYSATSLTVTLNGGLAGKGYQVTYDRTINKPSDSLSYMSTQAYTVGDSGTLSSNSAYVYLTMTNYKHIEKKATYNGSTQSIDWKINFNFDQDEISPSTVLTDVLADNDVEYVADSLKIKRVTFNATNGSPIVGGDASSDWTTSAISANGNFNLTYKNTNTNAYEITYSTKITDFSDRKIKNEITDENGVSADATIAIQPDLLKKEAGTIDYFNNTMTWKITANSDRIKMGNLNITDEFSTGVKALKSYTVRAYTDNINSVLLTEGKDYTIDKDVTPAGFYIQLIGDYATTDKKIVVDFVTEIDLSDVTKTIDNKASISYYDGGIIKYVDDVKASMTPDPAMMTNTYSTISLMSGLVSNTATTASPDYGSLPMTYKSRTTSISPAFTIGSGSGTATIGSLEITKVDKKDNTKKLAGAKFQLYTLEGDKAGQEATTDTDGKIVMDGLQSGKYKLVETEAPTGYTISDEYKDGKEITVTADAVTNVTIENTEQTGSAVLLKEDSVTKDAIAGAEFELQNADGTKVAENLVSNADGKIEVTDLAPGDYQFVETKAPTGYVLDATPSEFTIEFNQEAAVIVTKENTAKTGSVVLTKEDSVTKATIAGAEFDLQKADGTKVSENLVTDADGKIEANDLAPGDYQFVETKAAAGYVLDATPSEFTIEFNQDKAAVVTKENTAKSGSVVLTKQDSATKAALSDAEFELQTATGTKVKDNLTTNASGEIEVADLAPGDYKFIETKAPTGYELDATPVTFTIEFNQSTAVKVTKENVAKTGSVVLTKLDSKSRSNLAGAEFELQTKLGVSLKDKVVTEANGQLQIDNLAPGDYQLVETKAPTGYELDATPVEFTIEFNQKDAVQVTKTNKMSTGSVVLTKTDGQTKAPLADATFKLVDADNNVTENLTTDASGKLEITNLAPGDYQLIETKAPKGYELDTVPVDVKISFNQNQVLQVTKTNIKTVVSGKVIAEFVDTKGNVLAEQEIHAGLVGEKYVTKAKSIAGYKLTKDPTNKVGIYKEADQKVTFVYEKNKSPLVVDPTKPIKPSKPTKPSANPSKQATVKKAQSLPSTGDNSLANLIITGLFASTLGLFLLRKSKKVND
ncbi:LPXTG cell wall anchor domain-containing protein [Listeria monocytogenes]|nr:LPXTG cell wall anchor domain-containing protein [Listeria monocytogenes]EAE7428963.1 LPXTG cell wall anchor domain-containing protein [Listeria monocytogenes]EAE7653630.1 LPXTG cell wall anchor domain-containing protein [Listeria monocytogenes]EAE8435222.1 LPXTG cell wall anchor domain-containing protein [Listeria monocytogenes]EAE8445384.1 LPXTG cell wall anchor domain-containing protein [Listeria monocytogenes]